MFWRVLLVYLRQRYSILSEQNLLFDQADDTPAIINPYLLDFHRRRPFPPSMNLFVSTGSYQNFLLDFSILAAIPLIIRNYKLNKETEYPCYFDRVMSNFTSLQ